MPLVLKLNPPQLNGKLPAFYGNEIVIPFNLNRAVGFNQFDNMVAIVKSVSTNTQQAYLMSGKWTNPTTGEEEYLGGIWYDNKTRSYRVSFNIHQDAIEYEIGPDKKKKKPNYFVPQVGQYYKIQLACVNNAPIESKIGYYSSAGVLKCSAKPTLYIENLDEKVANKNVYEYVGIYQQEHDLSEKIYSYEFNLYDEFDNIIATSGSNIHNNSTDIDVDSSFDVWRVKKNLTINKPYYLQYKAITMNGLGELIPCESPKYEIVELDISSPDICAKLSAKLNEVEGYVQLSLIGQGGPLDSFRSGSFILLRSSSKDNYDTWDQLTEFQLSLYDPEKDKDIYRDYVIEQGVDYVYAIQAYNQQGYMSGRLKNYEGKIHCDFEDAFLYDGERQLKIRFNPTVDNFKSTILENKVDTIGNKYPFIFRNGIVNYKEFSISGLLSLLGDENKEFTKDFDTSNSDIRRQSPALINSLLDLPHQLTGDNYFKERQFKLRALEWLSDGKPKLFKSPAEGNYIVRLMGVSLSPEKTLGRMLHTFNCNACEIAECNFDNLDYYNLIPGYSEKDLAYYDIYLNNIDIHFKPLDPARDKMIVLPQTYEATITGAPGRKFHYWLLNDKGEYQAEVGYNGIFEFPLETLEKYPLISIELDESEDDWGEEARLTIGYKDPRIKTFSYIYDVSAIKNTVQLPQDFDDSEYEELPELEVILPPFYDNIVIPPDPPVEEEEEIPEDIPNEEKPSEKNCWMKDILKFLEDLRKKTGMFHYINISLRKIYELIYQDGKITGFIKDGKIIPFDGKDFSIFDPNALYKFSTDKSYFDGWDLKNNHEWISKPMNKLTNKFVLNDRLFNMEKYTDKFQTFADLSALNNFRIGNGLKIDVVYQEKTVSYSVENAQSEFANEDVIKAKEIWEKAVQDKLSQEIINEYYNTYLDALQEALNKLETKVVGKDVIYAI